MEVFSVNDTRRTAWVLAIAVITALALFLPCSTTALAGNWAPVVAGGFGDSGNRDILIGPVYRDELYVGTMNMAGCEVWRSSASGWEQVVGQDTTGPTAPGFGWVSNIEIGCMATYGGYLVAGVSCPMMGQGSIWRFDGTDWVKVTPWVEDWTHPGVSSMAIYNGGLYVGTSGPSGCEVWMYDGNNWAQLVGQSPSGTTAGGFGNANNFDIETLAAYDGGLYAGTLNFSGCELWHYNGANWYQDVGFGMPGSPDGPGFGNANNFAVSEMLPHSSGLYLGTWNPSDGCSIWRYTSTLTQIVGQGASGPTAPGFGGTNTSVLSMAEYDSHIYIGTDNFNGCEIWTYDGSAFAQVVGQGASGPTAPGFGNTNNSAVSSLIIHGSFLYGGIINATDGGGIWSLKSSTTWYLAEGATAGGYETWILVQNPGSAAVNIDIVYQTGEGPVQGPTDTIPPQSRRSYLVNSSVQTFEVSTKVTADADIICERAMYYTPSGSSYRTLGHDSIGVTNPGTTWYLAEGATDGGYEAWILVQNPGNAAVNIDIDYQTGSGQVQGPLDTVLPQSRKSYRVNNDVQTYDVSTRVTADADIICERAMYYTPPGGANKELGHDSIGVTDPGRTWYLAEGATDGGFETWVLVQNPGTDPVDVDIVYQTATGPVQGPQESIPGETRRSYRVNSTVQTFDVSTKVIASGDVICERAVYWTPAGSAFKVLGHDSIGYDP